MLFHADYLGPPEKQRCDKILCIFKYWYDLYFMQVREHEFNLVACS